MLFAETTISGSAMLVVIVLAMMCFFAWAAWHLVWKRVFGKKTPPAE